MKKKMLVAVATVVLVLSGGVLAVGMNEPVSLGSSKIAPLPPMEAEITFKTFAGEGCGCLPLDGSNISVYGLTTDQVASNITDIDGVAKLFLQFDHQFRVTISHEDYVTVRFDFWVVDDQEFTFHLVEDEEESSASSSSSLSVSRVSGRCSLQSMQVE